MTILLTGFEPFGDLQVNPSGRIVEHFAHSALAPGLVTEVLKTEFRAAGDRMRELIRTHRPEVVMALGVAGSATGVRLERQAANLDDARLPDNAGYQPIGVPIVAGGRPFLASTLPLEPMLAGLLGLGTPTVISDDAGRYVCNHVMYAALDEIQCTGLDTRCGFIHVPRCTDLETTTEAVPEGSMLSFADLIAAIERCLAVVVAASEQVADVSTS
jgi:pyroglutamyl-peptidase